MYSNFRSSNQRFRAACFMPFFIVSIALITLINSASAQWPGTKSSFHSFDQYDFQTNGLNCKVAVPNTVATGKPWVWRARFWGHKPNVDIALLNQGFHIAYVDVAGLYGSPTAVSRFNTFYTYLTTQQGFNPKAAMEGMSRGGLAIYNWSIQNPDKVYCIYADAPVCDFKSWPAGQGAGPGSPANWTECKNIYGFTEAQATAYGGNPIDNLAPLHAAGIPLLHVVGDADTVVPVAENTAIVESRYNALGGSITVIHKPGVGHVHGLDDPAPIVNFILSHVPVPPVFTADVFFKDPALKDVAYTGQTLAGSATDDPNQTLTYTKVGGSHSGPESGSDWLTIAANGDLSGTPANADVGLHTWTVQVSDGAGGTDTATLKIIVVRQFGGNAEPILGTGWNQDVIAESGAASALSATTAPVTSWVFYETGFTGTSQGLNSSRTYSGVNAVYTIPPYNANNAILNSGTFTPTTPSSYTKLGFLVTTQDASGSSWTATVTYSDASTQVLSGTGVDWTFPSTEVVVSNHGLARRTGGAPYTAALSMVERQFFVDSTKKVMSIQFATQQGIAVFHAISGQKTVLNAFETWQFNHFNGTSDTNASASQDPDGDGKSNTDEFAYGSDPNSKLDIPNPIKFDGTTFTITRRIGSMAGLSYKVENSDTLLAGSWTTVPSASLTVDSTSGEFETLSVTRSTGSWMSGSKKFLRMEATKLP